MNIQRSCQAALLVVLVPAAAQAKDPDYFTVRNLDGKRHVLVVTESRIVKEQQSMGEGVGSLFMYSSKLETYKVVVPPRGVRAPGAPGPGMAGFNPHFDTSAFGLANADAVTRLQLDGGPELEVNQLEGYVPAPPDLMRKATLGQDKDQESMIQLPRDFEIAAGKILVKAR